MHDQELIANVADAHARGFQELMNRNGTQGDAATREMNEGDQGDAATRERESIARIHHHYKQLEQQPVLSREFDSAKVQCEYDNGEWQERGFGYNWQNHLNDWRILLEYPEHRYAHRALNVMFHSE